MTPAQRKAAERLIDPKLDMNAAQWIKEVYPLLRELLAEPQGEPVAWRYRYKPVYAYPPQQAADEIEALRRDAERYRWLRDNTHPDNLRKLFNGFDIDAAMKEAP